MAREGVVCAFCCIVFAGFVASSSIDNTLNEQLKFKKDDTKLWALLVAGSNGYYNYRHQADACHSYQIMKRHGIPDEQIVVMMYDDIAYNKENPTPGVIINHPNGSDVYHGVPHDYTGDDVTPENFLNILQGNQEAMTGIGSGKVIGSGPNDHVFVYFTDHGADGLVAFPAGELMARDFMTAIQAMHEANKYKQMVIYIEACESGSMFKNLLPNDINVYGTTASNAVESSYACYYDDERQTYLGDWYSVRWMEDSDVEDLTTETLHKQFKIVKQEVNTSHVQQYGDKTIAKEPVGEFQGEKKVDPLPGPGPARLDLTPSGDVPLEILKRRLQAAKTEEKRIAITEQLKQVMKNREDIENSMKAIVSMATENMEQTEYLLSVHLELSRYDCYESALRHYDHHCFDLSQNEYALRHLYKLSNMCEESVDLDSIVTAIYNVCRKHLY